jgi:cytochrome c oxidase cbb3-type subunit III
MKKNPDVQKDPSGETLRPHVYDGIQEYDGRLPNWWLWTLYITIIFSVVYWFSWYDGKVMDSDAQLMEREMSRIEEARLAAVGELNDSTFWAMSRNAGFVASGKTVYMEHCALCHGNNLEGGIGLALVDNEWRYGGTPMEVYQIVSKGSPDRASGMQAWDSLLGPQRISQVVAYIMSHHEPE